MFTRMISIVLFAATSVWAQGVVQISSVTAEPAKVNCAEHPTINVVAQVAFWGFEAQNKIGTVSVGLSIHTATPSDNAVEIPDARKDVELRESPGLADFSVSCSTATRPGEVKLSATILSAPTGAKIALPAGENEVAKLTITK